MTTLNAEVLEKSTTKSLDLVSPSSDNDDVIEIIVEKGEAEAEQEEENEVPKSSSKRNNNRKQHNFRNQYSIRYLKHPCCLESILCTFLKSLMTLRYFDII